MKKQKRFNGTPLIWIVFLAIMPLLGACEKEEGMDENGIVSLSSIPKKPEYAKLPLIGTKWQLVGFANAKTGKVRKIKLYRHDNYILILEDRGKISGRTTGNVATGEYKLFAEDPNKISISGFGPLTNISEFDDEDLWLYLRLMNNDVGIYNITGQGLALYYDSDEYLLFKPLL